MSTALFGRPSATRQALHYSSAVYTSREQLAALYQEQQQYTSGLISRMDGGVVTSHRDLNSYCDQFAVEGDPADKVEPTE